MVVSMELAYCRLTRSSVSTFYFSANVTKAQLLPLRFAIFEELWPAARIELVAGEDLVKLFEDLELGLVAKKTFEIDRRFFDEFSKSV
jgi:hypothetical protein